MFLRRTRVELADFPEVMAVVRKKILNKDLYNYVSDKLHWAERENHITYISLDRVEALDKHTGDQFTLEFTEDGFATFFRCWNNHHREKKVVKYNGDVIIVKCEESTDVVKAGTGLPSCTSRKSKTQCYSKNQLFYEKEIESTTESDIENLRSSSIVAETFINADREAVTRTVVAGDEDSFNKTGVEYSYSSSYESPLFNSIEEHQTTFVTGFDLISEEAFTTFVEKMKTNEGPKLDKIN